LFELLRVHQRTITQQFGASAFYTVVRWHKLGEVSTECTSHKSIVLAIRVPKIIKFGADFIKFGQKTSRDIFWTTLYCNIMKPRSSVTLV